MGGDPKRTPSKCIKNEQKNWTILTIGKRRRNIKATIWNHIAIIKKKKYSDSAIVYYTVTTKPVNKFKRRK